MDENFGCNISVVPNCAVRAVDNGDFLALIDEVWFVIISIEEL
jgi:hypothetical protein